MRVVRFCNLCSCSAIYRLQSVWTQLTTDVELTHSVPSAQRASFVLENVAVSRPKACLFARIPQILTAKHEDMQSCMRRSTDADDPRSQTQNQVATFSGFLRSPAFSLLCQLYPTSLY